MKKVNLITSILLFVGFFLVIQYTTNAQFFDKLKKDLEKGVQNEVDNLNEPKKSDAPKEQDNSSEEQDNSAEEIKKNTPEIKWDKYDFVPGDEIIFQDSPADDEENGEFPSRWDLYRGNAEILEFNNEKVIGFLSGNPEIVPYLKNSKTDYLPEVFTIEFDAYFIPKEYSGRYIINLFDKKNQKREKNAYATINVNGIKFDNSVMKYPGKKIINLDEVGGWRHIALAFTKGKLKMYLDDTRLINIPHYEHNPTGLTISITSDGNGNSYIKNIRIAKGGVKYYDRFLSDGKIIVNGIRFDVGKAIIKPESYGAINKIYNLMKKHSDIKFSVEGHTDRDGDADSNLKLSEERAKAVMESLISLGIDPQRLEYKGLGETKPIDNNDTPEGKANNRRVEFVKI